MTRSIADLVSLGAAVRDARRARAWTQADLAGRAQVSRQFVIALERGASPRAELTRVLAVLRALDLRLALDDAPPPATSPTSSIADLLDDLAGEP